MQTTQKSASQNTVIHTWYDDNAESFADADVIEHSFVGMSAEGQRRLNRFKLFAVDQRLNLKDKEVLEFGAGHGRMAFAYPEMKSYKGVDYSQNLVNIGNQKLEKAGLSTRARLVHGDVQSHQDRLNHYDVVCSLGMMCYFEDAAVPVRKMVSHLKPGGDLFFDFRVNSWLYQGIRHVKWAITPPTGGVSYMLRPHGVQVLLSGMGLVDIQIVSREFPLLAGRYAKGKSEWPLSLRNRVSESRAFRPLATEAWVFARKPG